MNELETYLSWVAARISDADPAEEPDLELKASYPDTSENDQLWELADLLASLANDTRVDGFRALVYGPSPHLERPAWLKDEAVLRDKLLRHFEGGVLPGIELIRRQTSDGLAFDAFVLVDREEVPYVTRLQVGGPWVVRVRTNTSRRTATRGELIRLAGGRKPKGGPVRRMDIRLAPLGRGTRKLVVTNTGTINLKDLRLELPEGAESRPFEEHEIALDLLKPGETHNIPFMGPIAAMGRGVKSERLTVHAIAEDGEPVNASLLVSNFD